MSTQPQRVRNGGRIADSPTRAVDSPNVIAFWEGLWSFEFTQGATGPALNFPVPWVSQKERERVHWADVAEWQALATTFAARARNVGGVSAIYAAVSDDDVRVTVLTDSLDINRELTLRASFADLARGLGDSSSANLSVLVADDPVIDTAELGDSL